MLSPEHEPVNLGTHYDEAYGEPWEHEPEVDEPEDWEYEQLVEELRELFALSPSQFIEQTVLVPHPETRALVPFSFEDRPYLRRIYDTSSSRTLLMCGRQVEKSTTLGNKAFAFSCLIPHFKIIYVSPSSTQTKEFSKTRLKETMETCPSIRTWFPSRLTDNVYEKMAINRSKITLRYAFLNADRVRGLPADMIEIDEFQDILLENIPVIEESASHSPFKYFSYSGTPKSLDNPMQYYWDTYSTRNEWAVPCEKHGTPKNPGSWHWNILGEEHMGLHHIICDKCGSQIFANHPLAQWVPTGQPDPKYDTFEGFRIPQLMVPWIDWSNILTKHKSYPRAQFYNEVLGMSFDSGQRPLTRGDILANCDEKMELSPEYIATLMKGPLLSSPVYAGIDWGQDSTNSYTILALGAYIDGFFRIFFIHRFTGPESEPRPQIDKIKKYIHSFRVRRTGADHGGGHHPNDELLRNFGSRRIFRYQYSAPRVYLKWDQYLGRYMVNKHEVLGCIFNAIKRADVFKFPRWKDFQQPFASDMLSIFSEYNERSRTIEYKKSPNSTDDSMHAITLCFLASMIDFPRPDIFVPNERIDRQLDS